MCLLRKRPAANRARQVLHGQCSSSRANLAFQQRTSGHHMTNNMQHSHISKNAPGTDSDRLTRMDEYGIREANLPSTVTDADVDAVLTAIETARPNWGDSRGVSAATVEKIAISYLSLGYPLDAAARKAGLLLADLWTGPGYDYGPWRD